MSAGLVMAAGSRLQQAGKADGTPEELAADIWKANHHSSDRELTLALCRASGPVMDWLLDRGVPLEWMAGYRYPGHSRFWLHAPRERHGEPIVRALLSALEREPNIDLRLSTPVTRLLTDASGAVPGIQAGERLEIQARKVILAADGFGANREMVARFISLFTQAIYYGAPGCTGDAINWGMQIGAATAFVGLQALDADVDQALRSSVATAVATLDGELPRPTETESDEGLPAAADTFLLVLDRNGSVVSNLPRSRVPE